MEYRISTNKLLCETNIIKIKVYEKMNDGLVKYIHVYIENYWNFFFLFFMFIIIRNTKKNLLCFQQEKYVWRKRIIYLYGGLNRSVFVFKKSVFKKYIKFFSCFCFAFCWLNWAHVSGSQLIFVVQFFFNSLLLRILYALPTSSLLDLSSLLPLFSFVLR